MNGELLTYFEELLRELKAETDLKTELAEEEAPPAQEIEVRLFRLGKLRFAVLGEQLSAAFALEGAILPQPGQPAWAEGQVSLAGRKLWAVIPRQLLPAKRVDDPPSWALVPRAGELALLCHGVEAPCRWRPEQIRWRSERVSRPWLLGMQGELPCPLIDVECLVKELTR
jgi:hypothetical protein